jgi:4-hydroxy-tetrahydrodipicolinate synthase
MKKPIFTGVCTALVTPFLDGRVNYPMMEMLLKRQIDAGIQAVVVCGTTGESPTLSDEEKLELFYRCKQYAGDACAVIAGTGSNSTAHAAALSCAAQDAGVDGLLVVSPYYNKATPSGLIAHYSAIASSVSLPVIIYNVPGRTGVDIPVGVYRELAKIPNITGVKEASADINKIAKIRRECPEDFYIWSGNDDQIVPAMSLGAKGVISVLSNVLPKEAGNMAAAALSGDFETAAALQLRLLPLIEALFCEVNPIPVKKAVNLMGMNAGTLRLPLTEMEEATTARLKASMEAYGIL